MRSNEQIIRIPPEIIKRVEELPQYKDTIKQREKSHMIKKIGGLFFFVMVLSLVAYCSGCRSLRIPGTEDMVKEYKNKWFHVRGAVIGMLLGVVVALLSGCMIHLFTTI